MVQKCMKVQAKHGKVTQNMHGASRNYRYVWDVSAKCKEAKARKEAAAAEGTEEVGPSAKLKAGKKSAKRKKKEVIVSPPEVTSEEEANSDGQDPGTEADVEDIALKKNSSNKGIRIPEPAAKAPRATIDMTNLVTDPPISSAPPVQARRQKP